MSLRADIFLINFLQNQIIAMATINHDTLLPSQSRRERVNINSFFFKLFNTTIISRGSFNSRFLSSFHEKCEQHAKA